MADDFLHKQFPPYVVKKGEEYMNSKQLGHFRKILETLKAELVGDIERTVHTMQDEATVFADPNDRASQESDIALELRNRDRERKLIKKIDRPHRGRRIRLLRQLRRRDRPQAPGGAPHRDPLHRLQGARGAEREADREVELRHLLSVKANLAQPGYARNGNRSPLTKKGRRGVPFLLP
jgi:RNA polymerase-binding protein DksA